MGSALYRRNFLFALSKRAFLLSFRARRNCDDKEISAQPHGDIMCYSVVRALPHLGFFMIRIDPIRPRRLAAVFLPIYFSALII